MITLEAVALISCARLRMHRHRSNCDIRPARSFALAALALPFTVAGAQTLEAPPPAPAWRLELEFQHVDTLDNTFRKGEGYTGTQIDMTQYTGHQSDQGRLTVFRSIHGYHDDDAELRFVIAPFRISGTATSKNTVVFDGAQFPAGSTTSVVYKFNTYRISYLSRILDGMREAGWDFRLGGTLAIRDARTEVSQGGSRRNYYNWGPVPLLYLSGSKDLGGSWRLVGDLDAFPAPGGGGLFDGAVKVAYRIEKNVELNAGGRYEVGGAASSSFYNHLREQIAVVGVNLQF